MSEKLIKKHEGQHLLPIGMVIRHKEESLKGIPLVVGFARLQALLQHEDLDKSKISGIKIKDRYEGEPIAVVTIDSEHLGTCDGRTRFAILEQIGAVAAPIQILPWPHPNLRIASWNKDCPPVSMEEIMNHFLSSEKIGVSLSRFEKKSDEYWKPIALGQPKVSFPISLILPNGPIDNLLKSSGKPFITLQI
ncbi:MAG: hypothetical protein AAB656_02245 [Patescibacteria group bacterium]